MKHPQIFNLIQLFIISSVGFFSTNQRLHAAVIWSDINATPTMGSISVQGQGSVGNIPNIQLITPSDRLGKTISVDTLLSAVNNENDDFQEDVQKISSAGLMIAQDLLAGKHPDLTLLDPVVGLIGTIVKGDTQASIGAASYSAVADTTNDETITSLKLTFSALAVVEVEERRIGTDGVSFSEIQAQVTINSVEIPILFNISSSEFKSNPLEVIGNEPNESQVFVIRGEGEVDGLETTRGVLSISPVALDAQQLAAGGSANTFSSIVLTNWTATVTTTPEKTPTLGFFVLGTLGVVSALQGKRKK